MDPVTVFSVTFTAVQIANGVVKLIQRLHLIRRRLGDPSSIDSLIRRLTVIRYCFGSICSWANDGQTLASAEFKATLKCALESCGVAVRVINVHIEKYVGPDGRMGLLQMGRYVWHEDTLREYLENLDHEIQALQLLLHCHQSRTIQDQDQLLRQKSSQMIVNEVQKDTASMIRSMAEAEWDTTTLCNLSLEALGADRRCSRCELGTSSMASSAPSSIGKPTDTRGGSQRKHAGFWSRVRTHGRKRANSAPLDRPSDSFATTSSMESCPSPSKFLGLDSSHEQFGLSSRSHSVLGEFEAFGYSASSTSPTRQITLEGARKRNSSESQTLKIDAPQDSTGRKSALTAALGRGGTLQTQNQNLMAFHGSNCSNKSYCHQTTSACCAWDHSESFSISAHSAPALNYMREHSLRENTDCLPDQESAHFESHFGRTTFPLDISLKASPAPPIQLHHHSDTYDAFGNLASSPDAIVASLPKRDTLPPGRVLSSRDQCAVSAGAEYTQKNAIPIPIPIHPRPIPPSGFIPLQ